MKILLFANTDWYLYNYRLSLARTLRQAGHEVVLVSPAGEYTASLQEAGFKWLDFSFSRRGINPIIEWHTLSRLTALYREEKPDLVHHFTIKCVLYGSTAAHRAGVKGIVNSITGLGYAFINHSLMARILRLLVKRFYQVALKDTRVIFQNPDDQRLFLDIGLVSADKTALIRGSGINISQFKPLEEPDSLPLAILPGRMLWDKGIGDFVEAAHILRESGVRGRYALVGKSDPQSPGGISLEQLGAWQKEGDVEWWGWQEDIGAVYALAHVICLPSNREGVSRVLAEAAACARPLVATDVPGCREVVHDGENGFLVPPHDPQALAEALRKLMTDPDLRQRMGARSREIAVADFSEERVIRDTMEIYRLAYNG